MNNFKNAQFNFGLVKHYAIFKWHLTTNYLGGSSSTLGQWSQLSPPPPEECFKSTLNKLKPVCSKLIRNQNKCVKCIKSWGLHEKKLALMAKNRVHAAKSRIKRLKASKAQRMENQRLKALARTCADELARINKENESFIEGIKEKKKDLEVLKIERYLYTD